MRTHLDCCAIQRHDAIVEAVAQQGSFLPKLPAVHTWEQLKHLSRQAGRQAGGWVGARKQPQECLFIRCGGGVLSLGLGASMRKMDSTTGGVPPPACLPACLPACPLCIVPHTLTATRAPCIQPR